MACIQRVYTLETVRSESPAPCACAAPAPVPAPCALLLPRLLLLRLRLRPAPAPALGIHGPPAASGTRRSVSMGRQQRPALSARYPWAPPQKPVCEALTKTLVEAYAEKQGGIHGPLRKFLFVKRLQKPPWMPTWRNDKRLRWGMTTFPPWSIKCCD